jgi:hypothetical protein
MSGHTQGPWLLDGTTDRNGYSGWICAATGPDSRMEPVCHLEACSEADAKLIEAAPDMAEALRRIRDARDYHADHGRYPPQFGIVCFDDWAADIADTVLNAALAKVQS